MEAPVDAEARRQIMLRIKLRHITEILKLASDLSIHPGAEINMMKFQDSETPTDTSAAILHKLVGRMIPH